jgi:hypothetical protein
MSKQKDSGKLKNSVATQPQIVGLMPQTSDVQRSSF